MAYNSERDQTSTYACFGRRLNSIMQPSPQACPALTRGAGTYPVVYDTNQAAYETYPEYYSESYSDAYSGTSSEAYAEPYAESYAEPSYAGPYAEHHAGPCNQTNINYNIMVINADSSSRHCSTSKSGHLLEDCASSSEASESTARPPAPSSSRHSTASQRSTKRHEDWPETTQTAVGSLASYNKSVSTCTTSDRRSHGRSSHHSHAPSFQDEVTPEDSISQVSTPRTSSSSKGHNRKSSRGTSSGHHKSETHSHRKGHPTNPFWTRDSTGSLSIHSHSNSHKKVASSSKGSEYSHSHSLHSTRASSYADSIIEEPEDIAERRPHPKHHEQKKKPSRDEHGSHKKKQGSSHHSTHHSSAASSHHSSPAKNKKGSKLLNYLAS
ncbi:hypothetical protein F5Y03DRAFT_398582 [Xylaria venustula]|nr:hypothetical protein F5Y03DRAFT_398582 [Xylaria venustula]